MQNIPVPIGFRVPYIICDDPEKPNSYAERAYSPEELLAKGLKVDVEWYLSQQIHPPVARLCEHIEGTDSALLAECLGAYVYFFPELPLPFPKGGGGGDELPRSACNHSV